MKITDADFQQKLQEAFKGVGRKPLYHKAESLAQTQGDDVSVMAIKYLEANHRGEDSWEKDFDRKFPKHKESPYFILPQMQGFVKEYEEDLERARQVLKEKFLNTIKNASGEKILKYVEDAQQSLIDEHFKDFVLPAREIMNDIKLRDFDKFIELQNLFTGQKRYDRGIGGNASTPIVQQKLDSFIDELKESLKKQELSKYYLHKMRGNINPALLKTSYVEKSVYQPEEGIIRLVSILDEQLKGPTQSPAGAAATQPDKKNYREFDV